MTPLRPGSPSAFACVRAFLENSGYTERLVCKRLALEEQHQVLSRSASGEPRPIHDAASLLIALFLEGGSVELAVVRKFVSSEVLESMTDLGLLAELAPARGPLYSPVVLYQIRGLYFASDRWSNPDRSPFAPREDIVYPAITKNTYRFLRLLPVEPCARFLELCSGTGVAALAAAAGGAQRAWAVDITERSSEFAEFNRLLNGIENATILRGDLYEPVQNLHFDRIVAHPPYVPAVRTKYIFQDAGPQGEQILSGIVAGLPSHLAAGGRLYCLSLGADLKDASFEQRVRQWLGERHAEFDILVVVLQTHTPGEIASQPLVRGTIDHAEYTRRKSAFDEAGVEGFVYGLTIVQNEGGAQRPAFTARRQAGARTGAAEFEWALRWESAAASPALPRLLLESKPVLSKQLELRVLHRVAQGSLTPSELAFQIDHPFSMESHVDGWTAALVELCDGSRTGAELHRHSREQRWIDPGIPAEEFAGFLGSLVSGGFVEIEDFKPPAAAE